MTLTSGKEPIKELLTPEPDGTIFFFYTSTDYKPGSISLWLNGIQLIKEWDDGFVESDSGEIMMLEAPQVGDSLQAEYQPL